MVSSQENNSSLFKNPPLIEVIAEVHWMLKKLQIAPDAKVDLYYERFVAEFQNKLTTQNLTHFEELIPSAIPIEILPNQPRKRIRRAEKKWPLVQVGPGIITANTVPPYEGWNQFKTFLFLVIEGLFESYPDAGQNLFLEKLHLRYIDGFDERFDFTQYADFAKRMLNIQPPISKDVFGGYLKKDSDIDYVIEARFQNVKPDKSNGRIKVSPGRIGDSNALIMELHCETLYANPEFISLSSVKRWFEEAHQCLHDQFNTLVAPELKTKFQSRIK